MFRCRKIKMRCIPDASSGPGGPCKVSYIILDSIGPSSPISDVNQADMSVYSKNPIAGNDPRGRMKP